MTSFLEEAPSRLEEGLLLAVFAALSPKWTTSSALAEFFRDRMSYAFSGQQVRNALLRALENHYLERRPAVDPALKLNGPRTGPQTVFEYRLTPEGVAIFNRREGLRAAVLGYDPVLVQLPLNKPR